MLSIITGRAKSGKTEKLFKLLKDNAERAKDIISKFQPAFKNKEEYFSYIDALFSDGNRITYNEDNTATIRL